MLWGDYRVHITILPVVDFILGCKLKVEGLLGTDDKPFDEKETLPNAINFTRVFEHGEGVLLSDKDKCHLLRGKDSHHCK